MKNTLFYYHSLKVMAILLGRLASPLSSFLPGLFHVGVFSAPELFTVVLIEGVLTVFQNLSELPVLTAKTFMIMRVCRCPALRWF